MKISRLTSASLLLIAFNVSSTTVLADEAYMTGGHPYVGGAFGYGDILIPTNNIFTTPFLSTPETTSGTTGGSAYGVDAGYLYYQTHWAYGGELAYDHYPASTMNFNLEGALPGNFDFKASDIALLAVGKYFFTPQWNIVAKAGAAYVMNQASYSVNDYYNTVNNTQSNNIIAPVVGLGAGYQYSSHLGFSLEGQYIFAPEFNAQDWLGNALSLGFDNKTPSKSDITSPLLAVRLGITYSL